MNKIETMFYEEFKEIINCEFEKFLSLDDGEDITYQFYHRDIHKEGVRSLKIKRPEYPKTDFYIDSAIFFESERESCEINGFYPDFIFTLGMTGYAIEIDGYDWHERTKEQAINDRKKDRAYIKAGYIPVRFLGAEVYHYPKKCAQEFIELVIENELHIFDRESVERISYEKLELESKFSNLEKEYYKTDELLNNCCFGNGAIKALRIKDNKIYTTTAACEYGRKMINEK